ncbi:nitrous oxide reductase accessory protein NosL/NosD [Salinadaptatus halalkaliphilus]|uniref:Nitrous oxide reductase accessory protein NosL/NosD n=1 Tax=Salinadaptatus halalkaliphilus TaxID=2419781 RepID=A0A4V3VL86_9EURY|nr:NosD domain-containing protein [Salinadaptatus halalkaliphilus]THE64707.1 nitrous oxide reductase accessory protein NosL/NosD [Salinadaptatus halalkaliphilus]
MLERQWGRIVIAAVGLVVVAASVGVFVVDAETAEPEPVVFEETVSTGLALEDELALGADVQLPRAQVFYSQYDYVVGYHGIETFVESFQDDGHTARFGHPQAVYVTDYATVDPQLASDGHPTADRSPEWTDAEDAWFVVESDARTPRGETVLPFSDRDAAASFANRRGGTILDWPTLLERAFDRDDATAVADQLDDRHADADARVESIGALRDRPVSTVVGEDAATIQDALEAAPENTTVLVPAGTYNETLEIDRSLTLRGEGDVTIQGDGDGSVVTSTADRSAVIGVTVAGSGTEQPASGDLPGDDEEAGDWDEVFERNHAHSDAGIALHTAADSLVEDVTVDSDVTGILLRRSEGSVVRDATVDSPRDRTDGHAGILAFRSPIVIENATVTDGQDAIYAHRSPELVVRDSDLEGSHLGIHLMHTSDAILANNRLRNQSHTGIYVMTGPERIAIVDNDVRGAAYGIEAAGSDAYVADNRLTESQIGLRIGSTDSRLEGNVLAGNEVGAEVRTVVPTNQVLANDFIENAVHATAGSGPLRIWSQNGQGNYWQGATSLSGDATVDRSYSPTAPVDQRLHRTDGTVTLSRGPALDAIAGLEGSVPGMRSGSIVDLAPTCEPNNQDALEGTPWDDRAWSCEYPLQTVDP